MRTGREEEREFEMLLDEIPQVTSPLHQGDEMFYYHSGVNPFGMFSNNGSSSSGSSNGPSSYLFSEAASSSRTSGASSPIGEHVLLNGILEGLSSVHIGNQWDFPVDPYGIRSPAVDAVDWTKGLVQLDPEFPYSGGFSSDPIGSSFYSGDVLDGNPFVYGNNVVSNPNRFDSNWDITGLYSRIAYPMGVGEHIAHFAADRGMGALPMEDSFIIQGKDLEYLADAGRVVRREGGNGMLNGDDIRSPVRPHVSAFRPMKYDSLVDIRSSIYLVAKDQQGCRFLQRKLDGNAPEDVEIIFEEIIDHVAELMVNPFANYLMQKLFEVCTEEQRLRTILALTQHPFGLVQISRNNHGTRAVQKLIETLRTQQQIVLVISALRPGFLILIKDLNGHHVIQRCLQFLALEDNKFIFDAAAKHCVSIATDQHGCCVLQRCIAHSTGAYRTNLIMKIADNGLLLAEHPFGNYAVQFVMDLNNPLVNAKLMAQFKGSFAELSRSKFGSNVVEKCLKKWEDARKTIILELLAAPHFDMLLQHQYANYVILRALSFSKGPLRDALIDAIQPHAPVLRTSPYCKKIFSKPYFKKCTSY